MDKKIFVFLLVAIVALSLSAVSAADTTDDVNMVASYDDTVVGEVNNDISIDVTAKDITYGEDATSAALRYQVAPEQLVCIDLLYGLNKHRTLMPSFVTQDKYIKTAQSIFNLDGISNSVIQESVGFVAQRVLAMIVNLGCDIAQQGIATVEDINVAVKLGLGYPYGPIEWGDVLGADKILKILDRMTAITRDQRYRPSPWLRRRVQLGLPLVHSSH